MNYKGLWLSLATASVLMASETTLLEEITTISTATKSEKNIDGVSASVVVIDEAYIDFAGQESFSGKLTSYPNLLILQTLSKAWGSAAIRLGMAFASHEIIAVFNKIKYPYNINLLTQEKALEMLKNEAHMKDWVEKTLAERKNLIDELLKLKMVKHIYPTDANFVLVKVDDANATYQYLVEKGIFVRNRNTVSLCLGCLRITVGTKEENGTLLEELAASSEF